MYTIIRQRSSTRRHVCLKQLLVLSVIYPTGIIAGDFNAEGSYVSQKNLKSLKLRFVFLRKVYKNVER